MRCCGAAGTAPRRIPMAEEAGQTPGSRGSVSTTSAGMWESRHAPSCLLSCNPYAAAGAADPALAAQPWAAAAAAADSRVLSHRVPGDAWTQSVPGNGGMHGFLSLLEAGNVTAPEIFEDGPAAADDYLTALAGAGSAAASNMAGQAPAAGYGLAGVDDRAVHGSMGSMACYGHELERDNRQPQRDFGAAPVAAFLQEMIPSRVEKQSGLGYSAMGAERLIESYAGSSSFSDYRSTEEFVSNNRQQQDITPEMPSGSSGNGTTRRKSEERAGGSTKKTKKEASKASPPKPQAANVKLGEKITALQQIVSPFGKTDRASVLFETIKYIEFLHEQIQLSKANRPCNIEIHRTGGFNFFAPAPLFSEPYMTKSAYKGRIQFGAEEKPATQHDLRGSGLCLVPVSWTSQIYRDDNLPDCLTPAYRSCLYQ